MCIRDSLTGSRIGAAFVAQTSSSSLIGTRQIHKLRMTTDWDDDAKYLFDLNGFIIVRNVLSSEEVKAANAAINRHEDQFIERSDPSLRNAVEGTALYGSGPGRKDLGRVLEWGSEDSKVFKSILAHERLLPFYHGLLGKGYRMDHLPFVIRQDMGGEGFQLHGGTIDCSSGAVSYTHLTLPTILRV